MKKILQILTVVSASCGLFIMCIWILTTTHTALAGFTIIYVHTDATGTGTGLNWTDAFTEVQPALAMAEPGDEIWVGAGVYYPDYDPVRQSYTGYLSATFTLTNEVSLYGGFAGNETSREQRDWLVNVTILSGDLDRNDSTDPQGVITDATFIVGNNAWTIVTSSAVTQTAVLDGFTITGGNANDPLQNSGVCIMNALTISTKSELVIGEAGQLDENPAAVYLAGLSAGSRRTMAGALTTIARILTTDETADYLAIPWAALRFQHTAAIRSALAERYAAATANAALSALRGVLKTAWQMEQMSADEYQKAAGIGAVRGETLPAGRHVPLGEIAALLATCDQTRQGIRDAAVISLLYAAGLRRAELVALDLADYDQAAGTLRVLGKGNKQRLVPVAGGAALALADWLKVRGTAAGPLFVGTGRNNSDGRLTSQAVYKMLRVRAATAGIAELSPHDMRRSFVSELLDRGADIATVQQLAGHANVNTTARYDRRGEVAKRKAAELLSVPYTQRTLEVEGE